MPRHDDILALSELFGDATFQDVGAPPADDLRRFFTTAEAADTSVGLPSPLEREVPATTPSTSPEIQVAPGVSAPGGRRITPQPTPQEAQPITQPEINRLLAEIRNPFAPVTEVRLPDGTTVKGAPPQLPAQEGVPQTEGAPVPTAGGFLQQASDFIRDPQFQFLLGRAAQAIVPTPEHGAHVAGGIGAQMATNRAYDEYLSRLSGGESIESINQDTTFNILPPQLKAQALKDVLSERRAAVAEDYTRALTRQAEATAAGTLTAEEKRRQFDVTTATRLKVAEIGDNNWMNIGQGHVFNIDSGEIVKAYNYQMGGSSVGNLNASDYRLFTELTVPTYMNIAMANKRAEIVKEQGESAAQVADLTRFFTKEDGSTNFQAVMQYLSDPQRAMFAKDLNQYTMNVGAGIPPTATFRQQQVNTVNRTNPTTGQEETWRVNPDGTYTRIR